jgi:putative ABC transport system permease protein
VVELPDSADETSSNALREALARLTGIDGAADSFQVPGRDDHTGTRGSQNVKHLDGSDAALSVRMVGADFFRVYGLQAVAGRRFDPALDRPVDDGEQNVMLNMSALRALGWQSPQQALGQRIEGAPLRVVGVAPDLLWETLRDPVRPTMYQLARGARLLTLRMRADAPASLQSDIAAAWRRYYPEREPVIRPVAGYYRQAYADDVRLAGLLACATAVVFVLAAFGIYVLAAHSVQRRAREIVLRKLHGAGRSDIGALVGREFLLLTAVAALAGLPPAWLAIQRYLAPFAERSPLGAWAPAAALVLTLLVVAAATARHTLAAMRIMPADALRE